MSKPCVRKFTAGVREGKLPVDVAKSIGRAIAELDGRYCQVTVGEYVPYSSDNQREYYFAVIVEAFLDHFAKQGKTMSKEQMHDSMMRFVGGFSNPFVCPFTGEPDAGRTSYTRLTKPQAEGYHTMCRQWAAENGFDIPEPRE